MFNKRPPAILLVTSLFLLVLILLLGWIGQENTLYRELLDYQSELQCYHKKCFKHHTREKIEHKHCPFGYLSRLGKCTKCAEETFSLSHWTSCTKFLTCEDFLTTVRPSALLWSTDRWNYFLGDWNSYHVIYTQTLSDSSAEELVETSWETVENLSPHPNILYPIGACSTSHSMVFGMRDSLFPLTKLDFLLDKAGCNNWMVRLRLAIDYVYILDYLHTHPSGPHILCNSHSLEMTLSQFAVSQPLTLILTNFDNLPIASGPSTVVCSQEQLVGDFVAPEQKWPYSHLKMFNSEEQPGYDQASDIWKIPDITRYILGNSRESRKILHYLFIIHQKCKTLDHLQRPTARDVLKEYETVWNSLVGDSVHLEYGSYNKTKSSTTL